MLEQLSGWASERWASAVRVNTTADSPVQNDPPEQTFKIVHVLR